MDKREILFSLLDAIKATETSEERKAKVDELVNLIRKELNIHNRIQKLFDELMEV